MSVTVSAESYVLDPCGSCATAYWKSVEIVVPNSVQVVHARDYDPSSSSGEAVRYFRLIHDLKNCQAPWLTAGYLIQTVDIHAELDAVAGILNRCYSMDMPLPVIESWTYHRVFDEACWVFIIDMHTSAPAALGIADFDAEIGEGSLEWIQVLPEHRGKGLGQALVNELLCRLQTKARFATVSGQVDNQTRPEQLYRKCGFRGDDIWYVMKPE